MTDSYFETFQILSREAPHGTVTTFPLSSLRNQFGVPGPTSGGQDGMTSATAYQGFFYVIATSDSRTIPDAIFRIAEDGSSASLFSSIEIHDRGDWPWNASELAPYSASRYFLGTSYHLYELDGSGTIQGTPDDGNFDGVAVVGDALFAMTRDGKLRADLDLGDTDRSLTTLCNLKSWDPSATVRDIEFGSFGSVGEALFVGMENGDIGYWGIEDLLSGSVGEPTWLFNKASLFKIDFADGDMFVSFDEGACRIHDSTVENVRLEAVDSAVSVTEGRDWTPTIRLHLTAPPLEQISVSLTRISGDLDIEVDPAAVEFDHNNWRADAYVRVRALADDDASNGTAVIRASAPGLAPLDITVIEHDRDGPLALELGSPQVVVREGRTGIAQVRLTADPEVPLVVDTRRIAGDSDLSVEEHEHLVFDSSNWDRWQWISLQAAQDTDTVNGSATFEVSSDDISSSVQFVATEQDAGDQGSRAVYTVLVDDYLALPLQGETQETNYYNRLQGDHGAIEVPGESETNWGRGWVEAKITASSGVSWAGVWHSLNHPVSERRPLNFGALLPSQIQPAFQYRVTALLVEVDDGQGTLQLELKDPDGEFLGQWQLLLPGGPASYRVPIDDTPAAVQLLNWVVVGTQGAFARVSRVALEIEGPDIGYEEAFLWPYAALLDNYEPQSGLTRDRACFPTGDFDAVNASGLQAAASVLAARLGVITDQAARDIIAGTTTALLDLAQYCSHGGLLPHFVHGNFVVDDAGQAFSLQGAWLEKTTPLGFYGQSFHEVGAGTGQCTAEWRFTVTRQGEYEVFAQWTGDSAHASNAPYTVDGGPAVRVDQREHGGEWVSLGHYTLNSGTHVVTLSNDADGMVVADAIRVEGPPQIVPGTEFSSVDTCVGLLGALLASQAMGLPTAGLEQAIQAIDWDTLTLPNSTVSHGYKDDGALIRFGWDTFGSESMLVALMHAASTGYLPEVICSDPPTANGAGFIDEMLWLLVDPVERDAWGNDWTAYLWQAVDRQLAHVEGQPTPAFGASAGEPPIPSQVPVAEGKDVAVPYEAYGVGGRFSETDGSDEFAAPVVVPHYAAMVWYAQPEAAERMWDWMQDAEVLSPLNMVESLVVQQWGDHLETHYHSLKSSWNLGLWALGAGRQMIADAGDGNPLASAARANRFVAQGLEQISAQTQQWIGGVSQHWESSGNWSPTGTPGPDSMAGFDGSPANTPILYGDEQVLGVDLKTGGWTIGGDSALTLGRGGIDSAGSGTNTVDPNVYLGSDSTWTVGGGNMLVLNGALGGNNNRLTKDGAGTLVLNGDQDRTTGLALSVDSGSVSMGEGYGPLVLTDLSINSANARLDLADNAMIIDYDDPAASPLEDVRRWIASGCNGRLWDGNGIVSTVAAGSPATFGLGYAQNDLLLPKDRFSTFAGQDVDLTTVLVKYTYLGDVNLDGKVDDNDVTTMVLNYDRGLVSTHTWREGDVSRYDGKIDDNDITALVLNYGAGWKPGMGGPLGGAPEAAALPAAAPEVLMTPDGIPSAPLVEEADLLVCAQATRARQTALGSAQAVGGAGAAPTRLLARSGAYQGSAFSPGSGTSAADDPPLVFLAATDTPLAWSTAEEVAPSPDAVLSPDGGVEDLLLLPAPEVTPR